MIAGLRGTIEAKLADAMLVDVGGVIYRVGTSMATLNDSGEPGDPVRLVTHMVVREDQLTLFGFASNDELIIFESLISVTGIGPRLACAVLSRFRPETLALAIAEGDVDLLATAPGIGKKTAARLIVELRGKLPDSGPAALPADADEQEVMAALRALGYTPAEAHGAVARTGRQPGTTVEERVFAALRELSE